MFILVRLEIRFWVALLQTRYQILSTHQCLVADPQEVTSLGDSGGHGVIGDGKRIIGGRNDAAECRSVRKAGQYVQSKRQTPPKRGCALLLPDWFGERTKVVRRLLGFGSSREDSLGVVTQ